MSDARESVDPLAECFAGNRLHGDDFGPAELAAWYADEETAYQSIATEGGREDFYDYHALNRMHGFRHLPAGGLGAVLSFGGANGEEIRPIARRASEIVILEPGRYPTRELDGTTVEYRKPNPTGAVPARDEEFDTLICLGALHHVPNVSFVVRELGRAVRRGGWALIREPIVSMGDWRRPRPGLTKRERGIPRGLLEKAFRAGGFDVHRATRCVHPVTPRLGRLLGLNWFNSHAMTRLDWLLSALHPLPTRYHPTQAWRKIQPSAVFYVLRRH